MNKIIFLYILLSLFAGKLSARSAIIADPTRPVNLDSFIYVPQLTSDSQVNEYTLKKILISRDRRIAVINDQVLTVGDTMGEFVVSEIHKNKAVIVSDAIRLELRLINVKVRSE